jgi:excisionase family DNA binding protein
MLKEANTPAQSTTHRVFMDIPTAASLAGFSVRHFRRIIEEDRIPTMRIGRKFFILSSDFHHWKATQGDRRN